MLDMDWAQASNTIASALVAVCSAAFIWTYRRRAPWWSTPVGRHLVAVAATIGTLGVYTVLIAIWPHGTPAAVLRATRTLILLAIAGLMVQRTRMVLRTQDRGRHRAGNRAGEER